MLGYHLELEEDFTSNTFVWQLKRGVVFDDGKDSDDEDDLDDKDDDDDREQEDNAD